MESTSLLGEDFELCIIIDLVKNGPQSLRVTGCVHGRSIAYFGRIEEGEGGSGAVFNLPSLGRLIQNVLSPPSLVALGVWVALG